MSIRVITADITTLAVDAIVNAANETLLGGAGVDGAIHHAAGPALRRACEALPQVRPGVRCPAGEARITPGFELLARYVIHTVGPVWHGGTHGEPRLLAACHRNALTLAREHDLRRVAFPAISCGAYGYPPHLAARVTIDALLEANREQPEFDLTVCCFGDGMRVVFEAALSAA